MRAPTFWQHRQPDWKATALWPLSALYGAVALARFRKQPTCRADVPVICIGNPTVGGSGKTPTAILTARCLQALDRKPVFLSRGYRARVAAPVTVDPARHSAADVGDEPLLLARTAPTVVSPDRVAGARQAASLGDVIVMDDGFQNPALGKDLSLLVLDAEAGVGNGCVVPAGPLRLPLEPQLQRAQGLIVIGDRDAAAIADIEGLPAGLLRLNGTLNPDPAMTAAIGGRPVLAFAGIGRPEKFFRSLEKTGAKIVERRTFSDHHRYSDADARGLMAMQRRSGAIPVTTEKDLVRIGSPSGGALRSLSEALVALPVSLALEAESAVTFQALLEATLEDR